MANRGRPPGPTHIVDPQTIIPMAVMCQREYCTRDFFADCASDARRCREWLAR